MKLVGMREAREKFSEFVEKAQGERVVVTRHGRPALLLVGIEGQDLEKVLEDFRWAQLERAREQPRETYVSHEDAARELGLTGSPGKRRVAKSQKPRSPRTGRRRRKAANKATKAPIARARAASSQK